MKNSNNNNTGTKLILLHPYILKQGSSNRVWLLALFSLFTLAFLLTFVYTRGTLITNPAAAAAVSTTAIVPGGGEGVALPKHVMSTLIHYSANANTTEKMELSDLKPIADAIRKCAAPCNFLVFGLSHETLLWKSLNNHGRTVFIDENRYYAAYMEEQHPEIEAYDVQYTTKLREYKELIASTKEQAHNECRPVQNLLFSDCKLAINDLPNQFYDTEWDLILVDGPRGHWPDAPGRMATIFTAAVLARSKKPGPRASGRAPTHVFVHDYNLNPQRQASKAFLCKENLVAENGVLAHFVIDRVDEGATQFCRNTTAFSDHAAAESSS